MECGSLLPLFIPLLTPGPGGNTGGAECGVAIAECGVRGSRKRPVKYVLESRRDRGGWGVAGFGKSKERLLGEGCWEGETGFLTPRHHGAKGVATMGRRGNGLRNRPVKCVFPPDSEGVECE